jgi:hypothetical protein
MDLRFQLRLQFNVQLRPQFRVPSSVMHSVRQRNARLCGSVPIRQFCLERIRMDGRCSLPHRTKILTP